MPTVANTLTLTGTPLVTTPAAGLVFQQTGDTFGTTKMSLLNRTGINGPLFENAGLDLVDFGMKPSSGLQAVIRNRHTGGIADTNNPAGELEFMFDSLTAGGKMAFVVGEAVSAIVGELQIGTLNIGSIPANRDVGIARNAANVLEVNTGTIGTFATLKTDKVNAVTGYQINGAAAANKILKANGSNFVASTETYDAPGPAGNIMVSDGTNWKSKPDILTNASVAAQGPTFATDTYLTGSLITLPAGALTIGTIYRCWFDMSKTAAGTLAFTITIRIGTLGTTGDTSVFAFAYPAPSGTLVVDNGKFEVLFTVRTIGASATSACTTNGWKLSSTVTGLWGTVATQTLIGTPSAGNAFNATTATKIGLSVNGQTNFAGTVQQVIAELNIQ